MDSEGRGGGEGIPSTSKHKYWVSTQGCWKTLMRHWSQNSISFCFTVLASATGWAGTWLSIVFLWVTETLEATATRFLKRWSGLARSEDTDRLYLPRSQGGLNIPPVSLLYRKQQVSEACQVLASKNLAVWFATTLEIKREKAFHQQPTDQCWLHETPLQRPWHDKWPLMTAACPVLEVPRPGLVLPAFGQWQYKNYHLSCWSSPWTQYKTYYHTTQTWLCGEGGKACLVIASSVERDRHYSVSLTIALRHSTWVGTMSDMMPFWRASVSYPRDTSSWQTSHNFSRMSFPLTLPQLTSAPT